MTQARVPFRWIRKGRIFNADGRYSWMMTHAQNPTVLDMGDRLRIYFNCRPPRAEDGSATSLPTFLDVDRHDPSRILYVHDRLILGLGELGTFDQYGAMVRSVLRDGDEIKLYYGGWNRCIGVPFNHAIGLAVSNDGGTTFERFSKGPVLSRTVEEPFLQNSPYVLKIDGVYHMWYGIGTKWIQDGDAIESVYVMAQATSADGVHWNRDGRPSLEALTEDECQTNASVIRIGDRYHMWYSYRSGTDFRNAQRGYRTGYAWSEDLRTWNRDDAFGELALSPGDEWDSQMVCYPCVVAVDSKLYMFYCGNDFGAAGFGYAELDEASAAFYREGITHERG